MLHELFLSKSCCISLLCLNVSKIGQKELRIIYVFAIVLRQTTDGRFGRLAGEFAIIFFGSGGEEGAGSMDRAGDLVESLDQSKVIFIAPHWSFLGER